MTFPEGTTHIPIPKHQYKNSRYYKFDNGKWYRWSDSMPCWDFCGGASMNIDMLMKIASK